MVLDSLPMVDIQTASLVRTPTRGRATNWNEKRVSPKAALVPMGVISISLSRAWPDGDAIAGKSPEVSML